MMLALSVQQPWANHLIFGTKRIENRGWKHSHRGTVLIHAGLKIDRDAPASQHEVVIGAIIGITSIMGYATVGDARRRFPDQDQWIQGPHCWITDRPWALPEPIECRGRLGLFLPELKRPQYDEMRQRVQHYLRDVLTAMHDG